MISKNRQKLIHLLERKKGRTEHGLFVAEGPKLVGELLAAGWQPDYVAATPAWWEGAGRDWGKSKAMASMEGKGMASVEGKSMASKEGKGMASKVIQDVVTDEELQRCSLLKTPQQVLSLFPIPQCEASLPEVASAELCLALDGVQDPGNLGTIVRLADWFGIRHVFCSPTTADIYSPKAIQATMGAIARVHVHYIDLVEALSRCDSPIYGTHLDGENLYEKRLTKEGVIIMGNEGNGISPEVGALVSERLFIPPFPSDRTTVESLNVAIATAIVCAEFRRTKGQAVKLSPLCIQ